MIHWRYDSGSESPIPTVVFSSDFGLCFDEMAKGQGDFFPNFFPCCGFVYNFFLLNRHVSIPLQHIYEYFRLIARNNGNI